MLISPSLPFIQRTIGWTGRQKMLQETLTMAPNTTIIHQWSKTLCRLDDDLKGHPRITLFLNKYLLQNLKKKNN